jgi:hypothetical protein
MRPDLLLLSAALLAAPACAQNLTPLTFLLNRLPQGEHCGFFEDRAGGLHEAAGLDVTLLGGGPDGNVSLVAGGRPDIAANREGEAAFLAATAERHARCLDGPAAAGQPAIMAANHDHGHGLPDFKLFQMRDLDLLTGDGNLPMGAMTTKRRATFAKSMIAAGHLPADFDISPGYDLRLLSRQTCPNSHA